MHVIPFLALPHSYRPTLARLGRLGSRGLAAPLGRRGREGQIGRRGAQGPEPRGAARVSAAQAAVCTGLGGARRGTVGRQRGARRVDGAAGEEPVEGEQGAEGDVEGHGGVCRRG
jgi:hypothetical protein